MLTTIILLKKLSLKFPNLSASEWKTRDIILFSLPCSGYRLWLSIYGFIHTAIFSVKIILYGHCVLRRRSKECWQQNRDVNEAFFRNYKLYLMLIIYYIILLFHVRLRLLRFNMFNIFYWYSRNHKVRIVNLPDAIKILYVLSHMALHRKHLANTHFF